MPTTLVSLETLINRDLAAAKAELAKLETEVQPDVNAIEAFAVTHQQIVQKFATFAQTEIDAEIAKFAPQVQAILKKYFGAK